MHFAAASPAESTCHSARRIAPGCPALAAAGAAESSASSFPAASPACQESESPSDQSPSVPSDWALPAPGSASPWPARFDSSADCSVAESHCSPGSPASRPRPPGCPTGCGGRALQGPCKTPTPRSAPRATQKSPSPAWQSAPASTPVPAAPRPQEHHSWPSLIVHRKKTIPSPTTTLQSKIILHQESCRHPERSVAESKDLRLLFFSDSPTAPCPIHSPSFWRMGGKPKPSTQEPF